MGIKFKDANGMEMTTTQRKIDDFIGKQFSFEFFHEIVSKLFSVNNTFCSSMKYEHCLC